MVKAQPKKETATLMRKHLQYFNNLVKDNFVIKGLFKMKKAELKKEFDKLFLLVKNGDRYQYRFTPATLDGKKNDKIGINKSPNAFMNDLEKLYKSI